MATERDITGNVRFLVEAYKKHDALTRSHNAARSAGSPGTEKRVGAMKHEIEQIELGMTQAATDLVIGFLVDLHRAADALESIAYTETDRLTREIQR